MPRFFMKEEVKTRVGNALKVLSSTRVYTVVGGMFATKMWVKFTAELHVAVQVTGLICITILGLAYIASETIRKKEKE